MMVKTDLCHRWLLLEPRHEPQSQYIWTGRRLRRNLTEEACPLMEADTYVYNLYTRVCVCVYIYIYVNIRAFVFTHTSVHMWLPWSPPLPSLAPCPCGVEVVVLKWSYNRTTRELQRSYRTGGGGGTKGRGGGAGRRGQERTAHHHVGVCVFVNAYVCTSVRTSPRAYVRRHVRTYVCVHICRYV